MVEMEMQKNLNLESDIANVYTDDKVNGAEEEYEGWKVREFARIKRDKEATVRKEKRERVRNMTDEEMRKKHNQVADQNKLRFIRKYYHKEISDPRGGRVEIEVFHHIFFSPVLDFVISMVESILTLSPWKTEAGLTVYYLRKILTIEKVASLIYAIC